MVVALLAMGAEAASFDLTMGAGYLVMAPMMEISPELRIGRFSATADLGGLLLPFGAAGDAAVGVRGWLTPTGKVRTYVGLRGGIGGFAAVSVAPGTWQHLDTFAGLRLGSEEGPVAFDGRLGATGARMTLAFDPVTGDNDPEAGIGLAPLVELGVTVQFHRREPRVEVADAPEVIVDPTPVIEAAAAAGVEPVDLARDNLTPLEAERTAARQALYGVNWSYLSSIGDPDAVEADREAAEARFRASSQALREGRRMAKEVRDATDG
jgi:hypothetical protein